MIWWVLFIVVSYSLAVVLLYVGYMRVRDFTKIATQAETMFTVVIPFRNEAENIPKLLQSLQHLNYPRTHFEILFVDDASTDNSAACIEQNFTGGISFQILQNTPNQLSPKKSAISLAISKAQHPWIVTTDADCTVPKHWLDVFNDFIVEEKPVCVAAPVAYAKGSSFLNRYQQLDNWSLQAVTIGSFGLQSPLLSNGANFAYQKNAFLHVNGFDGNLHIASGDDIFLMEKFKSVFPGKLGYLKSRKAIVTTLPVLSWQQVISQRIRWASKTTKQKGVVSQLLGLVVFMMNLLLVKLPLLALLWPQDTPLLLAVLGYKMVLDYLVLRKSAQFLNKPFPFLSFLMSTIVYACITVVVVTSSFFGSYAWKQRSFKK